MKSIALLALFAAGCATVSPSDQYARGRALYGPSCASMGNREGSQEYGRCVWAMIDREDAQRRAQAHAVGEAFKALQPPPIESRVRPALTCTSSPAYYGSPDRVITCQ